MDSRWLWALALLLGLCSAQQGVSVCIQANAVSCGQCLQVSPLCGWCSDESYLGLGEVVSQRCDDLQSLAARNCRTIESPRGGVTVETSLPLGGAKKDGAKEEEVVQLQPQRISLALRIEEAQTMSLKFQRAQDLPVDLYFLTDLSSSMKDDLQNLRSLGSDLRREMQKTTSSFRIGLGSVSKADSVVPAGPLCTRAQDCPEPFVFRNLLSLTERAEQFDSLLQQQQISESWGSPEGGFNTILQVALCEEQIRWRENAVRVLVVSTDGTFHFSGDGKPLPQGGTCEMENGVYTNTGRGGAASSHSDFSQNLTQPTVLHLARKLYQKKIQTVFAVTEDRLPVYQELKDHLPKAAVGILSSNSSNLLELILDNYRSLSSEVVLDNSRLPDGVFLAFRSLCPNGQQGIGEVGGRKCSNVSIGEEVTFEVSVTAQACPSAPVGPVVMKLGALGFRQEVEVVLNVLCHCSCSNLGIPHSDKCSQQGAWECGGCRCNEGRIGRSCECSTDEVHTQDLDATCRKDSGTEICSNNGDCVCGQCECKKRENPAEMYSGQFCECDNFNCDRSNNKLCGGHGRCECRQCICDAGYTGSACDCALDATSCLASNGQICNGRGICECGHCKCSDPKFQGPTCEICPTCPGTCGQHSDCVQCRAWGSGPKTASCEAECSYLAVTMVTGRDLPQPSDSYPVTHCKERSPDDCWFYFTYALRDGVHQVHAVQNMDCPRTSLLDIVG